MNYTKMLYTDDVYTYENIKICSFRVLVILYLKYDSIKLNIRTIIIVTIRNRIKNLNFLS